MENTIIYKVTEQAQDTITRLHSELLGEVIDGRQIGLCGIVFADAMKDAFHMVVYTDKFQNELRDSREYLVRTISRLMLDNQIVRLS